MNGGMWSAERVCCCACRVRDGRRGLFHGIEASSNAFRRGGDVDIHLPISRPTTYGVGEFPFRPVIARLWEIPRVVLAALGRVALLCILAALGVVDPLCILAALGRAASLRILAALGVVDPLGLASCARAFFSLRSGLMLATLGVVDPLCILASLGLSSRCARGRRCSRFARETLSSRFARETRSSALGTGKETY